MNGFITMLKMNIKLLLRNKGYMILLIVLPIVAVLMLNLNAWDTTFSEKDIYKVDELKSENAQIFTMVNTKLSVKVYDCSNSELSDYIINELAKTGSYQIYRYRSEAMELAEARKKSVNSANKNIIAAVIYIPDSFESDILAGKTSEAMVFEATKDGRIQLLESNLSSYLQCLYQYAAVTGYHKTELLSLLNTSVQQELSKDVVTIETGNSLNLSKQQQSKGFSIGYSLVFLTIAFLFSGVFIAATVVDERNNRVFNRILLSSSSLKSYGAVKMVLILMTVLMQTGIIAIAIKLLVKTDFGISYLSYLFLVFCLGLIFNMFSVVIGVITNNVLASNYIAFLVWSLSCVLSGLYFPLDAASDWWAKISMLMPQRWVVKTGEMLMAGKKDAYAIFLLVVISYLFIISSVGFMGIKMRKKD